MHPKNDKNGHLDLKESVGYPDAMDPWITTMVTQDTKMEPRGLQNDSVGYKKEPISAVSQSAVAC